MKVLIDVIALLEVSVHHGVTLEEITLLIQLTLLKIAYPPRKQGF